MIDDHERIEELLAGYVLRSLSGTDAAEADRLLSEHVPGCVGCRATLDELQRATADLGLAADPLEPPDTLLPRLHRELEPQAPRRRPMQAFAVAAGVVAVVGLAGVTVSQSMRADQADARADSFAQAMQFASRDDARMVEVGPVQEITAPGEEVLFVTGDAVPMPAAGHAYRVWIVDDGTPRYVGEFLPDADGHVVLEIAFDPATDDDLWISVEPTDAPTDEPSTSDWWAASEAA